MSSQLRDRNELYQDENTELANWMIVLMGKVERAFHNLFRIELLLNSCESEEEMANIVTRRSIRENSLGIDNFAMELLEKLTDNSVSASTDF